MRIAMWNPFQELEKYQPKIDRIFGTTKRYVSYGYPSVDLIDAGDKLVIQALLPGMKREDIDVSVLRNKVSLSGERKREAVEEANYICRERYYGLFHKVIELPRPIQVDKVNAEYKNGILTITMPKEQSFGPITISIE